MDNVSATITFEDRHYQGFLLRNSDFWLLQLIWIWWYQEPHCYLQQDIQRGKLQYSYRRSAQFSVVDKIFNSLGATDNSTPFFGVLSDPVKVAH